jgi:predicted transcriptional regulator
VSTVKKNDAIHLELSRRERQIVDVIYRLGRATAAEVTAGLADPPTLTAVRTTLRILEDKGYLTHEQDGVRFVYLPKQPREQARKSALSHVVSTFFGGSPQQAMATLIDLTPGDLRDEDLDKLQQLIDQARKDKSSDRGR